MRLLIDATAIPPDRGGVGRYVDSLLPPLAALGVDLVVACQERDAAGFAAAVPSALVVPAPARAASVAMRMAWEQTGLPSLARRTRADVLHSPHYTWPQASPVPVVVTLHDATFFSHPELHRPVKGRFFRTWLRRAAHARAVLVVPSEATRREVVRCTGADPARFEVVPHGVDHERFRPTGPQEVLRVRASLGLGDEPYVAFLGTIEPRKNVPALVDAWIRAARDRTPQPSLVLAGARGWDDDVAGAITRVPADLRLVVPGYLPFEDLAPYLAGAAVVAYPSVGEGFGLPVLEAMACGAVVLTTRELSLPEVGGDAVAYTGTSAAQIGAELAALLDDAPRRASLAAAAAARATEFTWERSAAGHLRAYERALAGGRR